MLVAGTAAWWLCTLLGSPRPLFAVLVPLVAIGGDPLGAINISAGRMLGVFAGVLLGLALLQLHLPSTLLVALLLAASLLGGLALRVGAGQLNNQIAISAMFMLYLGVNAKAQVVGVARIWETAVGAAVAVVVSALLWPPDPLTEARERVSRLRAWLQEDLERIADLLAAPDPDGADAALARVRTRSQEAVRLVLELERGERALRFNPRRRRDRGAFALERRRLAAAARQYRHARALARIVADIAEQPLAPAAPERARLAAWMYGRAADLGGSLRSDPPDPGSLGDPRAVAIAVELAEMGADLDASGGREPARAAGDQRAPTVTVE
jgi:uncharacterized membrane protein YgaE (UPF0421/DUF939 family)